MVALQTRSQKFKFEFQIMVTEPTSVNEFVSHDPQFVLAELLREEERVGILNAHIYKNICRTYDRLHPTELTFSLHYH